MAGENLLLARRRCCGSGRGVLRLADAWIQLFNTISTDDAYVNGHVTFVAPRVPGQVAKVLVDDNYRVKKGDVLVQLDPEPYRIMVEIKQAAVAVAEADLVAANAQVRGFVGQARANRFNLEYAIEQVNDKIAVLRASVATLNSRKAALELATQQLAARRRAGSLGCDQQGRSRRPPADREGRRGQRRRSAAGDLRQPGEPGTAARAAAGPGLERGAAGPGSEFFDGPRGARPADRKRGAVRLLPDRLGRDAEADRGRTSTSRIRKAI